jgi:16S rRNA (guanine1207-N2)-methyltransferase
VTMLEVDAPSVSSIRDTLSANDLEATVLHSDVDSALPANEGFEVVVMNPPFHVGRDLKLDVALEFIRAAATHLEPNGEIWLVANHFLPYENHMRNLGTVQEMARERGFKVLKAGLGTRN